MTPGEILIQKIKMERFRKMFYLIRTNSIFTVGMNKSISINSQLI